MSDHDGHTIDAGPIEVDWKATANEMKDKGIHVGMRVSIAGRPGGEVRCACCGEMWPCAGSSTRRTITEEG